ncbi:hypothetical protein [Azospirillum sp. TSO22-1]|uniref:hypothetical protein n=1 Tax=Azospirillum sp. TSO22-1 TaxID=716789 RepID=UPI00130482D1|nr:hypothetical protein [Azospirillum sp. TSO22-1]
MSTTDDETPTADRIAEGLAILARAAEADQARRLRETQERLRRETAARSARFRRR